jgi:hypothetical protein
LYDSKWVARGDMGWWGVSSNENTSWDDEYQKALDAIPGDHWLTIVDCHI